MATPVSTNPIVWSGTPPKLSAKTVGPSGAKDLVIRNRLTGQRRIRLRKQRSQVTRSLHNPHYSVEKFESRPPDPLIVTFNQIKRDDDRRCFTLPPFKRPRIIDNMQHDVPLPPIPGPRLLHRYGHIARNSTSLIILLPSLPSKVMR